jgi:hypothetical protein
MTVSNAMLATRAEHVSPSNSKRLASVDILLERAPFATPTPFGVPVEPEV